MSRVIAAMHHNKELVDVLFDPQCKFQKVLKPTDNPRIPLSETIDTFRKMIFCKNAQ